MRIVIVRCQRCRKLFGPQSSRQYCERCLGRVRFVIIRGS